MEAKARTIETTQEFATWLDSLTDFDPNASARIAKRINRLSLGNPGDHRPLSGGVVEMKIDFGPGYRVYYGIYNNTVILLLLGGDKKTQQSDITAAQTLWSAYLEDQKCKRKTTTS